MSKRRVSPRRRNGSYDYDQNQEEQQLNPDVRIPIQDGWDLRPREWLDTAATYTAPSSSALFFLLFAIAAFFHESHFQATLIGIGLWLALQSASYFLNEDFASDLVWNILGALGNVAVYLLLGYAWSNVKLFLDVRFNHLPEPHLTDIRTCFSPDGAEGCALKTLLDLKWLIAQWTITWPVSIAYTLTRDPLRMFTDLLFHWSQQRYMWILENALSAQSAPEITTWTTIGLWILYVLAYFVLGYAWTHLKLFLDVWQGALPRNLEALVRQAYEDQNYWAFLRAAKGRIFTWIIVWPLSLLHTMFRHPVRIAFTALYNLSQRKYAAITQKAMTMREQEQQQEN